MRRLIVLVAILVIVLAGWSALSTYTPLFKGSTFDTSVGTQKVKVVTEESVTVDVVKGVGPSVVTIVAQGQPQQSQSSPFDPFGYYTTQPQDPSSQQPESIGSGFIVSSQGMIVTNKHVVSDTSAKYQVVTSDNKKYDVSKIYRDPLNDIAIVQINPSQNLGATLKPITMGDSGKLEVGQFVVAIGTALGQFRNTVTTGVVSGLGRGITAGDQFQGYVEKLDNVIQTSAAINPGNSGGPLVNSAGQVIGINTAVAQDGQNIGFALPINAVKDSLNNFNQTGQFNRPFLGIAYKNISKSVALLNDVPQGAYIQTVEQGSPADSANIQEGDIITSIDGVRLDDTTDLATVLNKKKVGDSVNITLWRDGKTVDTKATLVAAPNE